MTSHQDGIIKRYYEHKDTLMVQKLGEIASDLFVSRGAKADRLWDSALRALRNLGVDEKRFGRIVGLRDVPGLAGLVHELTVGAPAKAEEANAQAPAAAPQSVATPTTPAPATPSAAVTPETLRAAFKAFKKRLKLARLDEESKLGRSPLSHGKSKIVAIQPPREFPQAVWDELAKQGRLKPAGRGFYEMVGGSGE